MERGDKEKEEEIPISNLEALNIIINNKSVIPEKIIGFYNYLNDDKIKCDKYLLDNLRTLKTGGVLTSNIKNLTILANTNYTGVLDREDVNALNKN